jgi:hypothetical protein
MHGTLRSIVERRNAGGGERRDESLAGDDL